MAKHYHVTQEIAVKRINRRLFAIKQKIAYLLDKEWKYLSKDAQNQLIIIRMQIAELENRYDN